MQDYKLLERIGKGSFGQVFKACYSHNPSRLVAIKVLDMDTDEEAIEDVRKEIAILSKFDSNLITKYHTSVLVGTKLWVVMEYAGGGSIRHLLASGVIPEPAIATISLQVVQALVYLHDTAKIIHRDIKAANILLTTRGTIQLCDFGVAGQLAIKSRRNSFVGTPYWMAPEIIQRQEYDTRADIWSLGITVIEMATGNPPFADQEPRRALFLIPKSRPPKLSGDFSPAMKDFIAVCLKEDPEDRPKTAELLKHKFLRTAPADGPRLLKSLIARSVAYDAEHGTNNSDDDDDEQEDFGTENHWDFSTMRASKRYSHKTNLSITKTTAYEAVDEELQTPTPTNPPQSLSFEEPGLKLSMDGWPTTNSLKTTSPSSPQLSSPTQSPLERVEVYVQRANLLHEPKFNMSDATPAVSGWTGDGGWQGWGGPAPSAKPVSTAPQRPVPILPRTLRHSRSKSGSVVGLRPVSIQKPNSPTDSVSTGFSLSMDYDRLKKDNGIMEDLIEEMNKSIKLLESIGNNVRMNVWGAD